MVLPMVSNDSKSDPIERESLALTTAAFSLRHDLGQPRDEAMASLKRKVSCEGPSMALTLDHQVGTYAVVSATAYFDRDIIVQRFHPD